MRLTVAKPTGGVHALLLVTAILPRDRPTVPLLSQLYDVLPRQLSTVSCPRDRCRLDTLEKQGAMPPL